MKLLKTSVYCLFLQLSTVLNGFSQVPPNINSGNPNFPFPQFLGYKGGTNTLANKNPVGVPHAEMEQRMRDAYRNICNNMKYEGHTVGGVQYIQPNNTLPISHCTCVEADGYYLLAAAYMGDKTTFDGYFMWMHDRQFQKTQRYIDGIVNSPNYYYSPGISGAGSFGNSTNVFGGALGGNSAADGDVDVALALLLAWKQWGDMSGITPPAPYTGGQISYKAEAIKYIRTMVDTLIYVPSLPMYKFISGDIGFDGYMKSGDTWNETSIWAQPGQPGYTVLPERTGGDNNYVDYHAPAYFRDFADMLQAEGQPAWSIKQYRRGEASSDWVMGQAYAQGYIPWIGKYQVTGTTVNFSAFNSGGEDFRYGWRTILNYLWNGAPTYTWNPTTHQFAPGTNTYNLDMAKRFATFLAHPESAPYNNACFNASASVPSLQIGGVSNLRWEYNLSGGGGGAFILPQPYGPASPSAVVANDWDLMAQMFRQCVINFDDQGGGGAQRYLTANPQYFHEWFRLLGMLVLSGNFHSPMQMAPAANLKVYKSVNKTFAYIGDTVTYTISYRNYGKLDATNVAIKDTLDPGYQYLVGSSSKAISTSGNVLTWNVGTVKGMNTGNVALTKDSLTFSVVVLNGAPARICNSASIFNNGTFHWKSNEYPNRITEVMERNCVDILGQKPLSISKTVDAVAAAPGAMLTYTIVVKNRPTPFLNGGRPGVYFSGATDGVTASQNALLLKYRVTHGAHEPLINYKNYRASYYVSQTPIPTWGITTTISEGTTDPVTNVNTNPTLSQQTLVPGATWNHRFIITFPDRRATTTFKLTDNRGDQSKIHEGALAPLRLVNQLNAGWVNFNALDDWSAEPGIVASDGAGYFPITNDWTDPNNPNIPVNKLHPDQCGTYTTTVKKQLIEEWDGYTWRRIYGDAPVSGRELNNIVVKDMISPEVNFTGFVSGFPTGTVAGGTITWPTITQLLPNDSVIYKFTVKIKTPCPAFSTTNTATAKATNEPLSTANATTLITGTGCVLSIAPMEFKAQAFANGKAILTWNTTNDQDWQGYDIERSTDGIHFENIGTVGSLHLSTPSSYTFPTQIEVGTTYFRLKYSIQGVTLYSPVVALQRSDLSTVYLAPNPSSHQTRVVGLPLDLGETLVEAFTMEGQKVYSHSDIPQEGQFNVNAELIPGVYFLKVHALHDVKTFKLVIE